MQRLQAFKYELKPDGGQQRNLRRYAGSCRFVYNKALALQQANHEAGEKFIGYVAMAKHLTAWRNGEETPWLKNAPVHPLQHALKDLEKAYKNFFAKRADFPRFKRKGSGDSFRYPDPKQIKLDQGNNRIFLPKLGWIRYRNSREALGELRNVTVSGKSGKWYISIQTQREVEQSVSTTATGAECSRSIGIDLGIARFATFSDGSYIAPLNSFKIQQAKLAKYQRRMTHKQKFSNNWKKAKAKVQKTHTQIANARSDFLHKATTTISQNHAVVFVEDLQVRNMSKSAAGTAENPGTNVAAKSGLNKAILDQGWGEFRRQLDYKTAWNGGMLFVVPPHHTSQTCPCCGHVSAANRQTQARFACVECGYENHADVVGAINVKERGHRLLACGDVALRLSMKQESTEVSQLILS
ncbi:RNA-guided endonuclease InsQ/TnpB family protein [Thiothrix fructosivorans]|uniref:Transposase n=1 Tax=Thiothrix fructosivorans TaxID=111770 RepID=A0A8B0SIK0_9GAMM|nr:RNA-guided endonuclease TnpB family protein [Thiothrix fructosivorans]MBO0612510.1 transposase [Thiothrix fructosivorans]QTX12013.1 transposase [Thiothrix fructosivorans]